ncbi:MAG: DNA methyltransferase [Aureliella sp.]
MIDETKKCLESRMLRKLHVRFGVGVEVQSLGLHHVKVEPRSKNAIAAGLSSFSNDAASSKLRNDQGMAAFTHAINRKNKSKKQAGSTAVADAPQRKMRAKDRPLANDFLTDEAFDAMLDAWFGNMARVLLPGRGFYIWGGYANCGNYPPVLKRHGLYFSQSIIWDKQHPVLTRKDFMGAHEWCQPPDTMVTTPHGNVPIASLTDGDRVVSFNVDTSTFTDNAVCVTNRVYEGLLYCVAAGDRVTWCTPEHLWSVRDAHSAISTESLVVSTSNLITCGMKIPVAQSNHAAEWLEVNVIELQYYSGLVYSLEVQNDHHYVADGIVTHNCFYGWKEGAGHKYYGPNNATDLWHVKKIPPQQLTHLTGKPAELAVRAMQCSSVGGENVLDLFGGSGSTMIGAEQCGRKSFLMEIDAPYCDVICDRFQKFTGKPAVLERTGESPIPMGPREENMR